MDAALRELRFTDAKGRPWTVIDYRGSAGQRERVPIGSPAGEGRAFVPDGWDGAVLLHPFGLVDYRTTEQKILEGQLQFSKPADAHAVDRMAR